MDDGQQSRRVIGAELANDVEPAHVGQVHVQYQGVDGLRHDGRKALGTRSGLQHGIAMTFQNPTNRVARRGVIVDHQDRAFTHHRAAPL